MAPASFRDWSETSGWKPAAALRSPALAVSNSRATSDLMTAWNRGGAAGNSKVAVSHHDRPPAGYDPPTSWAFRAYGCARRSSRHSQPSRCWLPGRPGRLPAQGSHGSGRAQLRHPARPANHSHAPVARCDPQLTTASTAIRRPCVDRESGLGVPALFPDDGRLTGKPPSLHRLRAEWPVRRLQRYYEALRLLSALRPWLIGFAEDLPPCASDEFAPLAAHWQPPGPGTFGIG
jgi:hypothetical protein